MTPFYDSMIAKLIAHAPTREAALAMLKGARDAVVIGPKTNLAFLSALLRSPEVAAGGSTPASSTPISRASAPRRRPPDRRAVLAAARLLLARRDRRQRPRPAPFDPWGVADSFELIGPRRLGLDLMIDGKPERLQLVGSTDRPIEAEGGSPSPEGRAEITLFETADGGVYAFAGGRQAFVALIDPLEGPRAAPTRATALSARR